MKLGKFFATLGLGAVAGMLLAPKKGSDLRKDLKDKASETYDKYKDFTKEDVETLVNDTINKVKKAVDEFDYEEFKDASVDKLNEVSKKLEDLVDSVKDSDQYSKVKESVVKVSNDVNDKVDQVMTKIKEKDFDGMKAIDESIDEVEEQIDVIIEDLRN